MRLPAVTVMTWPATPDELREVGYRAIERAPCCHCGEEITWATCKATGGSVPLELVPDDDDEARRYRPHVRSCIEAQRRKAAESDSTLPVHKEA